MVNLSAMPNDCFTFDTMQYEAVVGQQNLKEKLKESVENNRISHAQLFLGPEGSGALPLALAYACDVIVQNSKDKASAQKKCAKLSHPDLHFCFPVNTTQKVKKHPVSAHFTQDWVEAVLKNPYLNVYDWLQNLGIENKQGLINVRQAAEIHKTLSLKSMESEYKVMVIWMAEYLNNEAASKLLKLLEEPPNKTLFILVAEESDQMLSTILSRAQLLRVPSILPADMRAELSQNQNCSAENAEAVTALSEGNYRKALRALQKDEVHEQTAEVFQNWMRNLWKKDITAVLKFVDEISKTGREGQKEFLSYGLHIFRECMVWNYAGEQLLRTAGKEKAFIEKFSKMVHSGNGVEFAEEFENAVSHIERNVNSKIIFTDLSLKCMKLLRRPANKVPEVAA